jgi:CheY-like chemotaxis protein
MRRIYMEWELNVPLADRSLRVTKGGSRQSGTRVQGQPFCFFSVQYQYLSLIDASWIYPHSGAMRGPEEQETIEQALVVVVDDDESVRESLPDLLKEFGFGVQTFRSGEEFLKSDYIDRTRCLILDIGMPGMSGPDLQKELIHRHKNIPIVFITGHKEETVGARVLEQGAVACLFKPFSDTALLEAINTALRVR